jgi:hypothetical protein
MTQEALKLALDLATMHHTDDGYAELRAKVRSASKEALAEHAMRETQRLGQEIEQKIGCVNHDCDQCKAQPEQEPVAHLWQCIGRWSAYLASNGEQANCAPPSWLVDAVNNATTPPQRQWVALTDAEIHNLRLIEAKRKEGAQATHDIKEKP